jgi:hypothetical protein
VLLGEAAASPPLPDWRRWLRRKIGWLLLLKLLAVVAMKVLFFSGESRVEVTPGTVDARLNVSVQPREGTGND